ncbi:MAG TPA: sigma-70 family RNA polymerase sigma factor [Terriglobia bacterium]|nr:sigma-70 family RNA polymerase sigma factor [Terriglobia bacterium]
MIDGVAERPSSLVVPRREAERVVGERNWSASDFEGVFLEYYGRIVSVLHRLLGDRTRSEELANDVFWRLYQQPLRPEPDGNVGGWLYRAATNLGIDALRANARRQRYEQAAGREMATGSDPDPLDDVLRAEQCQRVRAVLAALKPGQAQVLALRSSGCSYNELAEALGVKRGSVGTMLIRAEAEFKKRYVEMYGSGQELGFGS